MRIPANRVAALALLLSLFLYYQIFRWVPLGRWNWAFHFPVNNDQFYPDLMIASLLLWFAWSMWYGAKVGMWAATLLLGLWVVMHALNWWIPYMRSLPQNLGRYRYYEPHTQLLPAIGNHFPPDAGHAILDFILLPTWITVLYATVKKAAAS